MNPRSLSPRSSAAANSGTSGCARAIRGGNEAEKADASRAGLLECLDRGDARAAGSEHRVEHEEITSLFFTGNLEIVVGRSEHGLVAGESDVPDSGRRHQLRDAVHHAESGAENRYQGELLPGHLATGHGLER